MNEWFHKMSKEEQLEIEERLVTFILNKKPNIIKTDNSRFLSYTHLQSQNNPDYLELNSAPDYGKPYIVFIHWEGTGYIQSAATCYFKSLPERAAALLAIVYSPVYEKYKHYLKSVTSI